MNPSVYIALGSNMGDSATILRRAMDRLLEFSIAPVLKSSLWQTTPVDCPPGSPPFVNAVAGIIPEPRKTPGSLLEKLLALEREFGRKPKRVLNEPRRLDLDLICFGRETSDTETLKLPHPRATQRRFVLQPLAEIAPALVLPGQRKTVQQLLDGLESRERVLRL